MTRIATLTAALLIFGVAYADAWGTGSVDNDDALDWADECAKATSVAPVAAALNAAIDRKYIEVPEGSRAIAAAEVVAASLGKPSSKLPSQLRAWVQRQSPEQLAQLAPKAKSALARVLDPKSSELRQLWSEGKPDRWPEAIAELQSRLAR